MLSLRTVEPHTLELLKAIASHPLMKDMRLVGGTSLALQYGHRSSVDLDFFGKQIIPTDELRQMLKALGELTVFKETETIKTYLLDNIKVDFVTYPYNWIDNPIIEDGIVLASPKDIAAMKINAIEGRGTKKDFIDVFELLKHYSLMDILSFYQMKYPEYSIFRALLSLTYFDDAEEQMSPTLFIKESWEEIKATIKEAVSKV